MQRPQLQTCEQQSEFIVQQAPDAEHFSQDPVSGAHVAEQLPAVQTTQVFGKSHPQLKSHAISNSSFVGGVPPKHRPVVLPPSGNVKPPSGMLIPPSPVLIDPSGVVNPVHEYGGLVSHVPRLQQKAPHPPSVVEGKQPHVH